MSKTVKTPRDRCIVCGKWIVKEGILCRECRASVVMVTVREHSQRPYSDGTLERWEGRIRRSHR